MHDYIKPAIYSCIGDIAMAVSTLDKYMNYFLQALQAGVANAATIRKQMKESGCVAFMLFLIPNDVDN